MVELGEFGRADSSARLEHLLYTQGVTGSNPVPPRRLLAATLLALLAGCRAGGGEAVKPADGAADRPPAGAAADAAPDLSGTKVAVIRTERGTIRFVLLDRHAPGHVKNFVILAENGFFDNLPFHRVVPGMLIQGGDPKGDGTGGPGWTVKAEFNDRPFVAGTVGMARASDPDSAGSQWFIALRPMPQWDRTYTVFGHVVEGLDVVRAIRKGDRMLEVRIERVDPASLPAEALP